MVTATKKPPKGRKAAVRKPATKKPKAAKLKRRKATQGEAEKLLSEIEAQEQRCWEAEKFFNQERASAKEAHDALKTEVRKLRELIRASKNDAERPLLAQPATNGQANGAVPPGVNSSTVPAGIAANDPEAVKPAEDESWKPEPLASLVKKERILKALYDNDPPIKTIGDLAKWTSQFELTDVKGIGPEAATEISDALEKFWQQRKDTVVANLTGTQPAEK
jgi:hypothetical protein